MSRRMINLVLIAAAVLVFAVAIIIGAGNSTGEEGEKFGGTDAAVTEQLETDGYTPWFQPLFSPGSGEIESGLFAVQAALGAGALGYCLGRLHARRPGLHTARDGGSTASDSDSNAPVVAPGSAPA